MYAAELKVKVSFISIIYILSKSYQEFLKFFYLAVDGAALLQ